MKTLILIIFLAFCSNSFGQRCACDSNPGLSEAIHCDTSYLSNKSMLYWNYNCDSSWLTFENKFHKKVVLYKFVDELLELTERIGYQFVAEYRSSFLVLHNVISGCCEPAEYLLFNKTSGAEIKKLGRLIFYSENRGYPVIAYFENSNYDDFSGDRIDYDHVTILNIDKNTTYKYQLPKGVIKKTLESEVQNFPEHLVNESEIEGNYLIIKYRTRNAADAEWQDRMLRIDLSKIR